MKKFILVTAAVLGFSFCFAQSAKGGATVRNVNSDDPKVQEQLRLAAENTIGRIEEKDCESEHLGKIMFYNASKKDRTLEIVDPKGNKVVEVKIGSRESAYVDNIEVGEYYYKEIGSKKAKKKDLVNVVECMLKAVTLE